MTPPLTRRTVLSGLGATTAVGAGAAVLLGTAPAEPAPTETTAAPEALIGPVDDDRLHVMTFNIRHDKRHETSPGADDHWPERAPILTALLEREQPTLLGIQEAMATQLATLDGALPGHRRIGYGRMGGNRDEYAALYYDATRLTPLDWDQVWLSDTPLTIGSTSWGNEITRILVWTTFRDRRTGSVFAVVNTHFDHQSENARVRSAEQVAELVAGDEFADMPVIVTGDFNAHAHDSTAYATLVTDGPVVDTWDAAEDRLTPAWGTFPGYDDAEEGGDRIDWVLATDDVAVERAAINISRDPESDRYPSDHAPVQALLRLP